MLNLKILILTVFPTCVLSTFVIANFFSTIKDDVYYSHTAVIAYCSHYGMSFKPDQFHLLGHRPDCPKIL